MLRVTIHEEGYMRFPILTTMAGRLKALSILDRKIAELEEHEVSEGGAARGGEVAEERGEPLAEAAPSK